MVLVLTCGVAVLAPWRLAASEGVAGGPKAACPAGIETVAGFLALGDDGPALEARLKGRAGMAWDAAGNLYIADSLNHRVRMVTREGVIRTTPGTGVAGSSGDGGPAAEAALDTPQGIALDAASNLYIADTGNHRVRRVDVEGRITTIAGNGEDGSGGDGGPAVEAQLSNPSSVALDAAGNLYIADS